MRVKPDKSYFIDYKPESENIDLVERVKKGFEQAKADGYEYVFIIEDDDHYPDNYFTKFDIGSFDFYGSEETWYYNLRNRTYNTFHHKLRSSLFTTGFKVSAMDGFTWSAPRNRFLDIAIWEHAGNTTCTTAQFVYPGAIGIKHNLGLCAGKGHLQTGKDRDQDLEWLKQNVDSEAFDFYSELMKKL